MTDWFEPELYSTQVSITYNEPLKTYNEASITYGGKLGTIWTSPTAN